MYAIQQYAPPQAEVTDTLSLNYEARTKSRQQFQLTDGATAYYQMPAGTVLRQGDTLLAVAGEEVRIVGIEAAPEPLIEVRAKDALHFARAAYHLGNRHVKVELAGDEGSLVLRFQPDHVLEEMLIGLGCSLHRCAMPFQPEGGAYGGHSHGHAHGHGHESGSHHHGGPKIHAFR